MPQLGLIRVAAVTPVMKVADTAFNSGEIIRCTSEAGSNGASVIVLPELCITGYTCGDMFFQELLYKKQITGLAEIIKSSASIKGVIILGFYLKIETSLYNCAAVIQSGRIKGIVPKMFLSNTNEFNETRHFSSGLEKSDAIASVSLFNQSIPFGHLLFEDKENNIKFGIEICQDLFLPISSGSHLCLAGAHIICNPSASNEVVGKAEYRKNLILQKSKDSICGYVFASAGVYESSTDLVFSGHCIISENGELLNESERFQRENSIIYSEIDYDKINNERTIVHGYDTCASAYSNSNLYQKVYLDTLPVVEDSSSLQRFYTKTPFIPEGPDKAQQSYKEAFSIQTAGLAKRLLHTNSRKALLGLSGGLDSTLALLVAAEAFRMLGKNNSDIITAIMPGFGTSGKTYNNALAIAGLLGTDIREISIKESVLQHFGDIGQDPEKRDKVYENAQARERTQILMDVANMEKGIVIGTGDMSESALGFSTFNGDHMSMYNVNCGVPKTFVKEIINWFIGNKLGGPDEDKSFSKDNKLLSETLLDVLNTPISPELLPAGPEGNIAQKTEDVIGPYILHDFFLYHTFKSCFTPKKLLEITKAAFKDEYDAGFIRKCLAEFYRRLYSQQFKRNCSPDGPKVFSVGLSPRGDLDMPSDAEYSIWLKELQQN